MPLDVTGNYRYPSPDTSWLAVHREPVIEPSLPIVDAHHHLWEEPENVYLLPDLLADVMHGHRIEATVFVQCHYAYRKEGPHHLQSVGETERVDAIAKESGKRQSVTKVCAAIVAHADLCDESHLEELLEAHHAAAPERFRGVRQSMARDEAFPEGIVVRPAPAGMLEDVRLRRSLKVLGRHGLTFDAMVYHRQIPSLIRLAIDAADTQIVLDHVGCILGVGPYRGWERETHASWRRDMIALASCPNVSVKIGGFGMIVTGAEYHLANRPPSSEQLARDWQPYVETCIEAFGTERCMFESNFPVDKAMYSYGVGWNAFKRLTAGASESEKADLFSRTASRFYRLDLPGGVSPGTGQYPSSAGR